MDNLRVLLVDDEEELVSTLVERLEIRGIEASAVLNGTEALERVNSEDFDVVVLDVRLKGEDGIEVMEEMQRRGLSIPVILLTGHMSEETSIKGLEAGAVDYVVKPVDIKVLIEKMRRAVKGQSAGTS